MENNFSFDRNGYRSDVNFTDYYWFPTAFTPEELSQIEEMTSQLSFEKAAVGQDDSSNVSETYRKSEIKWCFQTPEWAWVYEKLHDLILEANDTMWKFDLSTMREAIQYTEYYEGGGHYDWHMDCGIGIQNQRKVSVTVQLSAPDEYEGGDLQFMLGAGHKNAQRLHGAAVVFPSFFLHRVTPVTKGTRKSFVLWVGGEPYK
jgi:PKHD-type hydroxylase